MHWASFSCTFNVHCSHKHAGTCYIDASSLLDRPSQFELPTQVARFRCVRVFLHRNLQQARWLSGAFAVIHPSGSRSGAAVRVRLQLRFKKMATSMKAATPSTIVPSSMSAIPAALERSPAPRASTPQLPSLPLVTASTLTLECVCHVVVPQDFESESVFLSLTTVLDGHIDTIRPQLCTVAGLNGRMS